MRMRVFVVVLALAAALVGVSSAGATRVSLRSGYITPTSYDVLSTDDDGNTTTLVGQTVDIYSGPLDGAATGIETLVTDNTTGETIFYGTEVCDCTVGRLTGTIAIHFRGRLDAAGVATGTLWLSDGTGGLTGLTGIGALHGDSTQPIPYVMRLSFPRKHR